MPAIYAQDRLRQRPPQGNAPRTMTIGSCGRASMPDLAWRKEIVARMWKANEPVEKIRAAAGYSSTQSVYSMVTRLGLPQRKMVRG